MSQKTNPISLRLQKTNKHFDSCWYSDFFYGQVLNDEINLRTYVEGLLFQSGRSKTVHSIQSQYKRYCTFLFFLDQRAERHKREFSLKISRESTERVLLPRTKFLQSRKKDYISAWNNLIFNQVQTVLRNERISQEDLKKTPLHTLRRSESNLSIANSSKIFTNHPKDKINKNLIEVTKQERSSFTYNCKQEYVYKFAIKGSLSELLSLAGVDSTKFSNRKSTDAYNSIINPGLKQNTFAQVTGYSKGSFESKNNPKNQLKSDPRFGLIGRLDRRLGTHCMLALHSKACKAEQAVSALQSRASKAEHCKAKVDFKTNSRVGSVGRIEDDFYTESKGFFSLSMILFAMLRTIPETEEPFCKKTTLLASKNQTFDDSEGQLELGLDTTSKNKYNILLKTSALRSRALIKESPGTFFCEQEGRENLFRSLVIDKHSQSSQNRLSFCSVKELEKQVRSINFSSIVEQKAEQCSALHALHARRSKASKASKQTTFKEDKSFKSSTTFTPEILIDNPELKYKSSGLVQQKWRSQSLGLARHTELFLNSYSGNFLYHTVYPVRAISPYQNAGFLLESVAYLLQRKSSFRQIKDDIFRELDQYQSIKGARLSCAGRLGGRSKKAQKAKTQTAQWGETSLTVLSSRLDFASKGVKTTYGKVGVKLWLCYKL